MFRTDLSPISLYLVNALVNININQFQMSTIKFNPTKHLVRHFPQTENKMTLHKHV